MDLRHWADALVELPRVRSRLRGHPVVGIPAEPWPRVGSPVCSGPR